MIEQGECNITVSATGQVVVSDRFGLYEKSHTPEALLLLNIAETLNRIEAKLTGNEREK